MIPIIEIVGNKPLIRQATRSGYISCEWGGDSRPIVPNK